MSEPKVIPLKIDTTFKYLQIFNGIFGLTDTELKILAEFVDTDQKIRKSGVTASAFSTESKKQIADKLGRKDFNTLNNYIKNISDKGAIRKTPHGYQIHRILIPKDEQEVIFRIKK